MKHYETKEIIEKKKFLVSITCDVCEKEINAHKEYFNLKIVDSTGRWYWKTEDAIEKQYCSEGCLLKDFSIDGILSETVSNDDFESMEITKVNKDN